MRIGRLASLVGVSFAIAGCGDDTTSGTGSATAGTGSTSGVPTAMTTQNPSEGGSATDDNSATADGSSTADTAETTDTTGDTGSEGSDSATGSATDSGSESGSESESGFGVCTAVNTTPLVHETFAGDSACEGVQMNTVIDDVDGLAEHNTAYCDTLSACIQPDPGCPFPPKADLDGNRVVYAFGTSGGCTGTAQITSVVDCGEQVEVHYSIGSIGPCGLQVHAWDSVIIPDGPPVVFIED